MYPVPNLPLQGSSGFHLFSVALTAVWRALYGVDLRIAKRRMWCPASRSCRMCCGCEVRARCDDVSSLETSHERVGPKIWGKKTTPKMDRLENPEETVMFWNPTCSFFKLRSSILGDSESARAIANVAGLSMQRGCGLSFLAIDSVAKPAMSGLEGCFFSQYESKNHPWLVMICIILYSCVLSCS